jgi:hypothetical protein
MFLGGFGQSGFENESYVLLSEISGENFRNFSQVLLSAVWGGSQILFALILRFINDWRIIIALIIGCTTFSSKSSTFDFLAHANLLVHLRESAVPCRAKNVRQRQACPLEDGQDQW